MVTRLKIMPREDRNDAVLSRLYALDHTLGTMCNAHLFMPPPEGDPWKDPDGTYEVACFSSAVMAKAQIEHAGFRIVSEAQAEEEDE